MSASLQTWVLRMSNILYTERLVLCSFREGDAAAMFRNRTSDERVAGHCRWHAHKSEDESEQYLKMCLEAEYSWAITLKGVDEPIGAIDVVGENSVGVNEIGYVLAYDYWGKGIMSEAVAAVTEELFRCGFDKIGACHDVCNPASGRVIEKCACIMSEAAWHRRSSFLTSYARLSAMK